MADFSDFKRRMIIGTKNVIWSDESLFTLLPTNGRVYVWKTLLETNKVHLLF